MILVATSDAALVKRKHDGAGNCTFHRSTFIGSDAGEVGVVAAFPHVPTDSTTPYPVAYLIELDPGSDLEVHFHRANQFQVFVQGGGLFGRHAVELVTVHYAGAYTAYGPIRPGQRGLSFFTLRDAWDPGARFLPDHKDELRLARVARREAVAAPVRVPDPAALQATGPPTRQTLLESPDDALGAWCQRLPPGAKLDAPPLEGSGGQFWLVLAGDLQWHGQPDLTRWSCAYVGARTPAPAASAGAGGVLLLVMRLPLRLSSSACTTAAGAAPAPAAPG